MALERLDVLNEQLTTKNIWHEWSENLKGSHKKSLISCGLREDMGDDQVERPVVRVSEF